MGSFFLCRTCQNGRPPTVSIDQRTLRGSTAEDIDGVPYMRFQGIPYAKPPVGNLRFKAPEPPTEWTGTFDATKEGSESYSRHMIFLDRIIGSENCLVLNVYTRELPNESNPSLKPVMFWIHGGGFATGSGNTDLYGPDFLITDDVVIVTINYRLGMLGFLSLQDSSLDVPGNAALKDMVMALRWVQKNISHFNGDPENVTIFGESAGGAAAHLLMLSPLAKGLFHKVIAQSGGALNEFVERKPTVKEIAVAAGLEGADEKTLLKYLQEQPVNRIFEIQENINKLFVGDERCTFSFIVEKDSSDAFLSKKPIEVILSGNFNQVPFMAGYNTGEGLCFEFYKDPSQPEDYSLEPHIPWYLGYQAGTEEMKAVMTEIKKHYYGDEEPSKENAAIRIKFLTDVYFLYGILLTVTKHATLSKSPVYLYRMSVESALNFFKILAKTTESGVSHCDDLGYLFKNLFTPEIKPGSLEDISMRRIVRLWTNFAKFGNPSPDSQDSLLNVTWSPVTENNTDFLDIGEKLVALKDPDAEDLAFWANLTDKSPAATARAFRMGEPTVTIKQGKLRGSMAEDIDGVPYLKFQGIPYAKPPIGDLRFKAPEPAESWTGTFDATKEGSASYSRNMIKMDEIIGSEDCLVLNVYTRELADENKDTLKPVMFWIHGGGFYFGSGNTDLYGPDFLITQDVVIVTINYRLGMLGFLSLKDSSLGVPGNAAFKDMVMALRWVKDNISYFNGDPQNVTVFGQSAGAAATHLLILSKSARGLFDKGILQSGGALNELVVRRPTAKEVAAAAGLDDVDEKTLLKYLQEQSVDRIFEIQENIGKLFVGKEKCSFSFAVEEDVPGAFLTVQPIELLNSGNYNLVSIMAGYNTAEALCFEAYKHAGDPEDPSLEQHVPWYLGYEPGTEEMKAVTKEIKEFYFGDEEPSEANAEKKIKLLTDVYFFYGLFLTVTKHAPRCCEWRPVYFYRLSVESGLNFFKNLLKCTKPGVCHCDDLGYLFKNLFTPEIKPGSLEDISMRRMVKLWTNFAKYGEPTPDPEDPLLNVEWESLSVTGDYIDFLDIGEELKALTDPEAESLAFWANLVAKSPAASARAFRNKHEWMKYT